MVINCDSSTVFQSFGRTLSASVASSCPTPATLASGVGLLYLSLACGSLSLPVSERLLFVLHAIGSLKTTALLTPPSLPRTEVHKCATQKPVQGICRTKTLQSSDPVLFVAAQ